MASSTTKFVAVNVTPQARDLLRLMAVTVSAAAGRRVSMSDALAVVDAIAKNHADELAATVAAVLSPTTPPEDPQS